MGLLDLIKEIKKVSDIYTIASKDTSSKAHHGKSGINFKKNYMPHVDDAISRAKEFTSNKEKSIEEIGCNIWKHLKSMKNYSK